MVLIAKETMQITRALPSLLGNSYGGDGTTTFALPDARGRIMVHRGNGAGLSGLSLGRKSGKESHTLVESELPAHQHIVP